MPAPSQPLPTVGQPNSTEDPKLRAALLELQQILTQTLTGLDGDNFSAALAQRLGLSDSLATRRGKSIVATTESRSNAAYGLMTTPDRVQNIALPTDGLIFVGYQATWQESVSGAARAAIFVGANQLKIARDDNANPTVQEATLGRASTDEALASQASGLNGLAGTGGFYSADVTTGQAIGKLAGGVGAFGICSVFAAAGTYDISIQFKASSGSVTAKSRKLWVWSLGF